MRAIQNLKRVKLSPKRRNLSRKNNWLNLEQMKVYSISQRSSFQRNGCDHKRRYRTRFQAELALRKYINNVLFSNLNIYMCRSHLSWHLGHNRRMAQEAILERDKVMTWIPDFREESTEALHSFANTGIGQL